jgi:hypothetical protein
MGITNTISLAKLAAVAAAVIHGYSHIVTDNLTSLHQIKNSSHTRIFIATTSKEISAMSMPCHLLQVCVQGAGVRQEREPSNLQLAFSAPQTRFLTH